MDEPSSKLNRVKAQEYDSNFNSVQCGNESLTDLSDGQRCVQKRQKRNRIESEYNIDRWLLYPSSCPSFSSSQPLRIFWTKLTQPWSCPIHNISNAILGSPIHRHFVWRSFYESQCALPYQIPWRDVYCGENCARSTSSLYINGDANEGDERNSRRSGRPTAS